MINLTSAQKALLLSNSVKKVWTFDVYNGDILLDTIPISKMVSGSLSIKEALCTAQKIDYASCEAATLTVQLADIDGLNLKNKKLILTLSAEDNDTSVSLDMGVYYIDDAKKQNSSWFHEITAYDGMVLFDVDVAAWYNALTFPMTLLQFRTALCAHVGVTQAVASLPCDALSLTKTIEPQQLQARDVLKAICQLNGCFGHFNRSGLLMYVQLGTTSVIALDKSGADHYRTGATHEGWTVPAYDAVTIQSSEDDIGATYPVGGGNNILRITDNFLAYDLTANELETVATAVYGRACNISYVVHNTPTQGRPWLEVGDKIDVNSDDINFSTYILERALVGFQGLTDALSAKGTESTDNSYTASEQIKKLKQRENYFSRTVDHTVSRVTDLEEGVTELQQDAGKVSIIVTTANGELKTVINGTSWGATFTDNDGNITSGLTFDFQNSRFVFNGSGKFTGEINVADKFLVTAAGDVTILGNSYIYGGRYYANAEDSGGFTTMDATGFNIHNEQAVRRVKIGFSQNNSDSPYIILNSGSNNADVAGLFKKFSNGLWIGNSVPIEAVGEFEPQNGYQGIFVSFEDAQTYVVSNTNMTGIYTGEAIAKFG